MADRRREQTKKAIKDSLLDLMETKGFQQITVAELCRHATISRSTFYTHFTNTHEVFIELVRDFMANIKPLREQLRCAVCQNSKASEPIDHIPFCVAIRNEKRMRMLVHDPLFLPTLFEIAENQPSQFRLNAYEDFGLDEDEARILYRFQMTGCYTAAICSDGNDDWERMQSLIDTFIQGGRNALGVRIA